LINRYFKDDNNGSVKNLVVLVLTIVIVFAVLFIGAFVNGEINESLTSTYPTNTKTGSVSLDIWSNGSVNGSYIINLSSPNTVEQLDQTTSKIFIHSTGAFDLFYNLTVNGNAVNTTSLLNNSEGYNHTVSAFVTGGFMLNGNSSFTYQWDANSTDVSVEMRTAGTYFGSNDVRTGRQNASFNTMDNVSGNWDSSIDIVQVVIIITILAMAVGAIFIFTRFR